MSTVNRTVASRNRTISVKPLPETGKPEGFSGAVGNFNFKVTNLQSNFTKTNYIEVTKVDSVAVILKDGGILQKTKAVSYILKKIKRLSKFRNS